VATALLLEYYNELPKMRGDEAGAVEQQARQALEKFKQRVAARYTEGTLHRLLGSADASMRRAAILALGLLGTMKRSNAIVAGMLHDQDGAVRRFAGDALWSLWFTADTPEHNSELQRIMEIRDRKKRRGALDALIHKAPQFAEAFNQRAILHFQNEEWHKAIADCERVLKLNPYHFGAASGLGRCCLHLGRHRPALKAFRHALRIHPGLEDVEETIRTLETALDEEGRRDDKK
jgi:tetratricopeptide (TPR) repeat protein